jgi:hypothetical protein
MTTGQFNHPLSLFLQDLLEENSGAAADVSIVPDNAAMRPNRYTKSLYTSSRRYLVGGSSLSSLPELSRWDSYVVSTPVPLGPPDNQNHYHRSADQLSLHVSPTRPRRRTSLDIAENQKFLQEAAEATSTGEGEQSEHWGMKLPNFNGSITLAQHARPESNTNACKKALPPRVPVRRSSARAHSPPPPTERDSSDSSLETSSHNHNYNNCTSNIYHENNHQKADESLSDSINSFRLSLQEQGGEGDSSESMSFGDEIQIAASASPQSPLKTASEEEEETDDASQSPVSSSFAAAATQNGKKEEEEGEEDCPALETIQHPPHRRSNRLPVPRHLLQRQNAIRNIHQFIDSQLEESEELLLEEKTRSIYSPKNNIDNKNSNPVPPGLVHGRMMMSNSESVVVRQDTQIPSTKVPSKLLMQRPNATRTFDVANGDTKDKKNINGSEEDIMTVEKAAKKQNLLGRMAKNISRGGRHQRRRQQHHDDDNDDTSPRANSSHINNHKSVIASYHS